MILWAIQWHLTQDTHVHHPANIFWHCEVRFEQVSLGGLKKERWLNCKHIINRTYALLSFTTRSLSRNWARVVHRLEKREAVNVVSHSQTGHMRFKFHYKVIKWDIMAQILYNCIKGFSKKYKTNFLFLKENTFITTVLPIELPQYLFIFALIHLIHWYTCIM